MSSDLRQQLDPELKAAVDEIQLLVKEMQELQGKRTKQIESRTQLGSQTHENELVRSELEGLDEGAGVYKLIGPVLVSQDTSDARTIVQKRLEFIAKETKRCEQVIVDIDKQEEAVRSKVMRLQAKVEAKQQALAQQPEE